MTYNLQKGNVVPIQVSKNLTTKNNKVSVLNSICGKISTYKNKKNNDIEEKKKIAFFHLQSAYDLRYVTSFVENNIFTLVSTESLTNEQELYWLMMAKSVIEGLGELEQISDYVYALKPVKEKKMQDDNKNFKKVNRLK